MGPKKSTDKSKLPDWSARQKFDLIQVVRDRPALWDNRLDDYSKRHVIDDLWEEIAEVLKCEGEYLFNNAVIYLKNDPKSFVNNLNTILFVVVASAAKTVWRNLRVYFTNLRRGILSKRSGQGLDEVFTPKWQCISVGTGLRGETCFILR